MTIEVLQSFLPYPRFRVFYGLAIQIFFALKVIVDRPDIFHFGTFADRPHRGGLVADFGKNFLRRIENPLRSLVAIGSLQA